MNANLRTTRFDTLATHPLAAFARAADTPPGDETLNVVFPEDFTTLSDEDLNGLHDRAVEAFNALYGDGTGLTDDDVAALSALTDGIETVQAERVQREALAAERADAAAALASRVNPAAALSAETETDADTDDETDAEDAEADAEGDTGDTAEDTAGDDENAAETITASATRTRREVRIPLARTRRQLPKAKEGNELAAASSMSDLVFATGDGTAYAPGTGLDWGGVAEIVEKRLSAYSTSAYASAARAGRPMRQQFSVAGIRKSLDPALTVTSDDPQHVSEVLARASSESRLQGNSLVASGGWCAPSETVYDLLELESRDGLFSLPEVGIRRGGIRRTLGPSFSELFALATGFHYTEAEDVASNYDGAGGGSKPCFKVPCPDFEEFRLEVDGICISAGLLQQRGYPEMIARTTRGALTVHAHRLAARHIANIEAGSTAVTLASPHGTAAPVLQAAELQIEHLRYTHRLPRSATIEVIAPFWLRGAIRADLAERNGVDLLAVTDAQITAWFALRGAAVQFVYGWQDINPYTAATFTGWPAEVKLLLYPAGTWVAGASDIITIDTLFDSTLLGTNDYTALFTEEGFLTLKMGHDSRVVTVPIDADGVTGIQADLSGPTATVPAQPVG